MSTSMRPHAGDEFSFEPANGVLFQIVKVCRHKPASGCMHVILQVIDGLSTRDW